MALQTVSIDLIRANKVALRNVDRENEQYQGIVASMTEKGWWGSITVREREDAETEETFYEIVDGLHRYTAAKEAGLTEIGIDVVSLEEDEVLEAQLMANIHKVETKPKEYSEQLRRIMARNPMMTEGDLGKRIGKSAAWIRTRLGLNKITNEQLSQLINSGKIPLSNAYVLAKLPADEQVNFVQQACTEPTKQFSAIVAKRVKEINEEKRKGKDAGPRVFEPVAHLRKLSEVRSEFEEAKVAPLLINELGLSDPLSAFKMGIAWALHMDPKSVEIQKSQDEQRKVEKAEAKKKRAAETAAKKAAAAKKKAEEAAEAAVAAKAELEGASA
jgi:ParB/RepB/Spo0J family partition protein